MSRMQLIALMAAIHNTASTPPKETVQDHTCRWLLVATLHADHVGDSSCFQAVVLCFIMAVAAHVGLVAAGPNQLAPASRHNHMRVQYHC